VKQISLVLLTNSDLEIIWAGPELKDYYPGLDEAEIKGANLFSLFKGQGAGLKSLYRWTMASEKAESDYEVLLENSKYEHADLKCWGSGENLYFKITATKEDNGFQELQNSFWSYFSKSFPGGFVFLDKNYKILEMSQAMVDYLNLKDRNNIQYSKNALIDKSLLELLSLRDEGFAQKVKTEIDNNDDLFSVKEIEESISYSNKKYKIYINNVVHKKEKVGSCLYLLDVTKEAEQIEELETQRQQLFYSSKLASLGEMAGGIAHEINNPLAIIAASCRILKKSFENENIDKEKMLKLMSNIDETVDRISKIIMGLRNLTGTQKEVKYDHVPISQLLENTLSVCQERFKQNAVDFNFEMDNCSDQTKIWCNEVQLSQVLLNLINNAYHAAEVLDEKWVNLRLNLTEDHFEIQVLDSGTGIPLEIEEKIFNPFFTSKEFGKGTGLGLSISKQIIDKHKGELYLNREAPNTCFVIKLPNNA